MFAPTVLAILSFVFIALSAAVVRVLGTGAGYKAIFSTFAFFMVLKTLFEW